MSSAEKTARQRGVPVVIEQTRSNRIVTASTYQAEDVLHIEGTLKTSPTPHTRRGWNNGSHIHAVLETKDGTVVKTVLKRPWALERRFHVVMDNPALPYARVRLTYHRDRDL